MMVNQVLRKHAKVFQMLDDQEFRDIYLNRLNYLISLRSSMPEDTKIVLYGAGTDAKAKHSWVDDRKEVRYAI